MVATGRSGETIESGSYEESIYPTEYDPPELNMGGSYQRIEHFTTRAKLKITAWETRLAGSQIEIEPTLTADGMVNLRCWIEIVSLLRIHNHYSLVDRWGKLDVVFPIFESLRHHQSLQLKPGVFILTSVHKPKHPDFCPYDNTRIMVFFRADIITPAP